MVRATTPHPRSLLPRPPRRYGITHMRTRTCPPPPPRLAAGPRTMFWKAPFPPCPSPQATDTNSAAPIFMFIFAFPFQLQYWKGTLIDYDVNIG